MRKFLLNCLLVLIFTGIFFGATMSWVNKSQAEETAALYVKQGQELYNQGKYDEAVRSLRKAVEINSEAEAPHYVLAMIYEKKGQNDQAIQEWNEVIRLSSNKGLLKSARIHLERLRRLANE
ncbi:MAG: tetratricopeptide repeat protein [bacterium]